MTLNELKAAVREHMTDDQVRGFGNLSYKATWEAAYDKCSEAIALAADAVKDAQQPAQDTAETVCDVLYSQQSRDIVQWVAMVVIAVIFTMGLLTVKIAQSIWQATAPLRARVSGRIHSEWWALVGSWPDLLMGL